MSYNYYESLKGIDKDRYDQKLKEIGLDVCPYQIRGDSWLSDVKKWPPTQHADLFNYLVLS